MNNLLTFVPRHDRLRPTTCMCAECVARRTSDETRLLATYPNGLMLVEWRGERRIISTPAT